MDIKKTKIETKCVQEGYESKNGEPRVAPIVQSTTYKYDKTQDLADIFDLKAQGFMYTRLGNPTLSVLEDKIAAMEGGVGALTTASGQSATLFSVINICKAGQNFIAMNNIYGGSHTLFSGILKDFGIDVRYATPEQSQEEILNLADENTRLIFGETIGNPTLDILDFEKFHSIAKKLDIPFVVDNTFATPFLCTPIEYGADIVVHSTTKYIDGHATSMGGLIVDSGNFNWENGKYPELAQPDPNYHGVVYTQSFGSSAFIVKARAGLLRDIGATMAPFNAFLTNLGCETLHLRMERHCENALAVAKHLAPHEKISWIRYPFLETDKSYELAKKYLKGGSGVVTFGVKGGLEGARTFIDNMQLATLVTHVGDLRTHALHPASTTHRQLSDEQQSESGILPDMVRFSVGIEHKDDIIADLDSALEKVQL